jgi:hypothetical protein
VENSNLILPGLDFIPNNFLPAGPRNAPLLILYMAPALRFQPDLRLFLSLKRDPRSQPWQSWIVEPILAGPVDRNRRYAAASVANHAIPAVLGRWDLEIDNADTSGHTLMIPPITAG